MLNRSSNSRIPLFLALCFGVVACGKPLHLALKKTAQNKANTQLKYQAASADTSLSVANGQIQPFSIYDVNELQTLDDALPFQAGSDAESPYVNFENPTHTFAENGQTFGFVENSSVVFRALSPVPETSKITDIDQFELHLKGLYRFHEKGQEDKTLSSQVLCLMDGQVCSGELPGTNDDKKIVNPKFSASAITSDVFSETDVSLFYNNVDTGFLSLPPNEVVLDLKKAFNLSGKTKEEIQSWIESHSTEYDQNGNRKFRFIMGNQVYFQSGNLVLTFKTDGADLNAKLPISVATHGADDEASATKQFIATLPKKNPAQTDGLPGDHLIRAK